MKKLLLFVVLLGLVGTPGLAAALSVGATPLWTDTGITVSAGETWRINADPGDLWNWGGSWDDAAGVQPWNTPNTWDRFLFVANHGELIGYVGADPYQGNWGNLYYNWPAGSGQLPGYLHVGEAAITAAGFVWTSATSGTLWLGMNDDAYSRGIGDNWGSIDVSIAPVPEPATMLLLGSGLLGLAGLRRRKR